MIPFAESNIRRQSTYTPDMFFQAALPTSWEHFNAFESEYASVKLDFKTLSTIWNETFSDGFYPTAYE